MSHGSYSILTGRRTRPGTPPRSRPSRPGAALRLRTWWRRDRLDQQLARGTDPSASAALALRAEQLGSDAGRVRLAEDLDDVLLETREPLTMSGLLVRRRPVRRCTDEVLALAHRLRDNQPIGLRGAAMTAVLLADGAGPLYNDQAGVPLRHALQSARQALDQIGDG